MMTTLPPTTTPPDDTPARALDVEDGLRFNHLMGMQTKLDVADLASRVFALTEELVARGQVNLRSLEQRAERLLKEEGQREKTKATVMVAPATDKYKITDTPQIDCAALIPICKGRCCKLHFPLSFQDLDERVLQWEYRLPYNIRHRDSDGYCVHSHPESRGCTVYDLRPAICRTYDCRKDRRIWLDFENKIPAPAESVDLVQIRKPPAPTTP
jgi:Fe-S-cluster containining protein